MANGNDYEIQADHKEEWNVLQLVCVREFDMNIVRMINNDSNDHRL